MKYLLDTNTCIHFLNGTFPLVKETVLLKGRDSICLCSIVKAELYFGAMKSRNVEQNIARIDGFAEMFFSYPFDDLASLMYGKIRATLEVKGTPIGPNDLMIGAIAIINNATLVTNNTKEFSRIDALSLEDWTK